VNTAKTVGAGLAREEVSLDTRNILIKKRPDKSGRFSSAAKA
jgi:hypothetical protein